MSCEVPDNAKMKEANRRYVRAMAIAGGLYVLVVLVAVTLIRHSQLNLPQWAVVVIALTPLIPALLMMRAYLTYVRAMDEFNRRIQSEAMLIAAGVVGLGCFTYSFLEEWAQFPRVSLIWVLPAMILVWGVATAFVRRRYK